MANLYELSKQIEDFDFEIDEETGEITNAGDLDKIIMDRDEKIENIALYIKNLTADAEAYKAEKQSFVKKEQAAKKKAEWLKSYLADNLQGEKFKTDRVQISYRKSESVEIVDSYSLTAKYLREKLTIEPDKTKIKEAIKDGSFEGDAAILVEKKSIQIK